jgi:hypothetical protein
MREQRLPQMLTQSTKVDQCEKWWRGCRFLVGPRWKGKGVTRREVIIWKCKRARVGSSRELRVVEEEGPSVSQGMSLPGVCLHGTMGCMANMGKRNPVTQCSTTKNGHSNWTIKFKMET